MSELTKLKQELANAENLLTLRQQDLKAHTEQVETATRRMETSQTAVKSSEAEVERLKQRIREATPWTPQVGEQFWYVTANYTVDFAFFGRSDWQFALIGVGNAFSDRRSAEIEALRRRAQVKTTPKPRLGDDVCFVTFDTLYGRWKVAKCNVRDSNFLFVMVLWNAGRIVKDEAEGNDWIAKYGSVMVF